MYKVKYYCCKHEYMRRQYSKCFTMKHCFALIKIITRKNNEYLGMGYLYYKEV